MNLLRSAQARWGLLATTLILGATLIGTTWASHRSILRASSKLTRSEGEALVDSIRRDLRDYPGVVSTEDLAEMLDSYRSSGLLYVAIYDPHQAVLVGSAGEPTGPELRPELGLEDQRWFEEGDVYHLVAPITRAPPGRRPPGRLGPPRGQRPGPPGGGRRDGRLGPPLRRPPAQPLRDREDGRPPEGPGDLWLIVEGEAFTAPILRQQTAGSLATGTASALVLMVAGLLFWNQARARERAQRQLEQQKRLSTLGEMSAILAHEIRNPLASLKGNAQLLAERMGDDHPEGRRVRRIVGEAVRLEKLTTDLLSFVRSGSLDRQPTDPLALVEEVREEVAGDRLEIDGTAAPASWSLDRARFRQVLSNLLRNAVEVSPPGVAVEVVVKTDPPARGRELVVTVRDHGTGLPQGHEDEIFEPFFTTRTRGTGLGLAVARRIVEQHGGSLTGRNHPGGGAEFEVRVPA